MAEPMPTSGSGRGPVTRFMHGIGSAPAAWAAGGTLFALYMRFVRATGPIVFEPGNPFEFYRDDMPFIFTVWHGQHFMVPYLMRRGDRLRGLISKSRDGDASAAYLGNFGIEAIRGSGGRDPRRAVEKGAVRAFLQLKKSLDQGVNVGTIADISHGVARQCGNGVITLARASGRPIVPLGFATSRWIGLKSWDKATVHLPFSRMAAVAGELVEVPRDADDALMEAKRLKVESRLNAAMARAYAIVGRRRE